MIIHIYLTLLLIYLPVNSCSSILLDWSLDLPLNDKYQNFLIEYTPPVGEPPTYLKLPKSTTVLIIKNTLSSRKYNATVSIIKSDGTVKKIAQKTDIVSHPDSPKLESMSTTASEAVISFIPPNDEDLTFYLKYYPLDNIEYANVIETKATLVKLQGLRSNTEFSLQIFSMDSDGALSMDSVETTFKTKGENDEANPYTIRTLPTGFTLPVDRILSTSTVETTYSSFSTEFSVASTSVDTTPTQTTTVYEITEKPRVYTVKSSARKLKTTESTVMTIGAGYQEQVTKSDYPVGVTTDYRIPTTSFQTEESTVGTTTKRYFDVTSDDYGDDGVVTDATTQSQMISTAAKSTTELSKETLEISLGIDVSMFPEPTADIYLIKEGNNVRVEWEVPEDTICDAYMLKYTILSLSTPKTYSVGTVTQETTIKMFPDHQLQFTVFCLLEGSTSRTWWAQRVVDFSRPEAVRNLHVVEAVTDEFYVSQITIDWDWPENHNFDDYRIVVSYAKGKITNGKKDMEIESAGPVTIEKLDPSQLYIITVKNVSRELELSSQTKGVRRITPPVITSTLYPGQISSTAININFGESDPEHVFDRYELVFSGNTKNINKTLEKEDEKSFTFTRLIPGKTYNFELYTIYKGIKSRAVVANVTTYPLKVDKLYPVVGKNYVVLYWDVQNFVDSDCRFRLSYTGTSNSGHQSASTVELNNTNKYRFEKLDSNTYYTFTITVIMGVGDAQAESESEMITIGISEAGRTLPVVQRYGTRELAVTFENDQNAFADTNGVISNYAVIVTEDTKLEGDDYELKSWFEVREEEHWPPYRASPSDYNPFKKRSSKAVTFIIGEDDCEKRRLDEQYCNGMLRANVDYFVKIRSYSVSNIAMETDWASVNGIVSSNEESSDGGRRLPCHMYLNGCPRKNNGIRHSTFPIFVLTVSVLTTLLV